MRKVKWLLKKAAGPMVALSLILSFPSSAMADTGIPDTEDPDTDISDLDGVTASVVELEAPAEDQELADEEGELFETPVEENAFLQTDDEDSFAAARTDLNSEIAIIGVTWDPTEVDTPASIQLRSFQDDTWSEWDDIEVPDIAEIESATNVVGTDEYMVIDAEKVEVVAIAEDGQAVDGIALNVIDPLGAEEVENELEIVDAEGVVDEGELGDQPEEEALTEESEPADDPADSQEETDTDLDSGQEDILLDTQGAVEAEGAMVSGFSGELGVASALPTKLSTGYLSLVINTRADWGANESYRKGFVDKNVKYRGAVVHHTAGSNNYTKAQVPSVIRGVYYYHAVTRDWGDIGYHFLVDKYGGVWEGRYKTLSSSSPRGAHAYGANSDTFGISVLGDYMKSAPPTVAENALAKTIAWKLTQLGITNIDTTIKVPGYYNKGINLRVVSAHRDVGATDCPGDAFYKRMPQIRTKVKNYMAEASKGTPKPAAPKPETQKVGAWDYGNIISDEVFYNGTAMTASQIQTFLNKEGASCKASGSKTCLKNTKFPTKRLTTLRGACKPLTLTGNQTAAKIIAETGKACGLNPQVLLANLQKESSGIYQPLTATGWAKVMGSACPDGKPCDPKQAGFAQQVYYGADKLASYRLDQSWPYIAAVKSGKKVTIPYKYNKSSCGSASFVIKNNATASLYTYTPFAPNSATLAKPSAGGSCSSPGWIIFRNYMVQWFPESMKETVTSVPTPKLKGTVRYKNKVSVSGVAKSSWSPKATKVTYQWYRSGTAIKGATASTYTPVLADVGKTLTVKVKGTSNGKTIGSKKSAGKTVTGPTVTRLSASSITNRSTVVNTATAKAGKPLFIVSSQKYAHNLSVAPAVASEQGSMLLVSANGPTDEQVARIKKLAPSKVYIIGSKMVLPSSVFSQVKTASGKTPVRVTGTGRYSTSQAIYDRFFATKKGKTVFVATGRNYWYAMSASAAGGTLKSPVIILDGKAGRGFTSSVAKSLKATGRTRVVLVGGTNSISPETRSAIRAQGFATVRMAGSDRYSINASVNEWLNKQLPGTAVKDLWVAPGVGFSAALTGAVPASAQGQRLVLSKKTCIPSSAVKSITASTSKINRVRLIGASSRLSPSIKNLPTCG